MNQEAVQPDLSKSDEKPFLSVIVHSFFVIPFLIAVFCILLFAGVHMLTREKRNAADYLKDVKSGGATKRWQSAFELSRMLANPRTVPTESEFSTELIKAFQDSANDDPRVRQYLALAMGRTGNPLYAATLVDALSGAREETLSMLIYALGMLKEQSAAKSLYKYATHEQARIRSITVAAIGNLGESESLPVLKKALADSEPNVQWGAAISLAKLGDASGKNVLERLLDRQYLSAFPEVDLDEQNHLLVMAVEAAIPLKESILTERVRVLAQSDTNMDVRAAALKYLQHE
jgi:HEAT repeat protein